MPNETTAAPEAAPVAAPTENATSTPSGSSPSGGSFISNALSALSDENPESRVGTYRDNSPSSPDSQNSSGTQDEEDVRADADIKRETANMPASQRAAFTKLRYEARDLKRQIRAASETSEAAKSASGNEEANVELERVRGEYETMKARVANYEKDAYVTRLESTDTFQKEVVQPRETVATSISDIAKRYSDIDQDAVVAAVRSGDPDRISRVTADMSEFDRYRFYQHVEKYHEINSKEDNLRANSKESLENIYRTQREQQQTKAADDRGQWEKAIGDVWSKLENDFPILGKVEGDEDWNKKMETVRGFASPERFDNLTVRERAEALHRAAAFPVLISEFEAVLEELKATQDKISKYEGATPGVSSTNRDSGSGSGMGFGNGGFLESALSDIRRLGAR